MVTTQMIEQYSRRICLIGRTILQHRLFKGERIGTAEVIELRMLSDRWTTETIWGMITPLNRKAP